MATLRLDFLITKIISILENEAWLIGSAYDELDELKRELKSMRSFLEDADNKGALTEGERAWIDDVRDMCYPVEDILEEFMYRTNRAQILSSRFAKFLHLSVYAPKNLWLRHQLAIGLQRINKKIKSIPERRQRYAIEATSPQEAQRLVQGHGESLVFAKDNHLVGIQDDRRLLTEWLTDGELRLSVISVVGMGGSGKSTLVANVYNNLIVKCFDLHAWITVSKTDAIEDIFRRILKEFYCLEKEKVTADIGSMGIKDVLARLVDYLRHKRYVVVFDDVWTSNILHALYGLLPDEGLGSRVILTTRNEQIASSSFGVKTSVLHVKPLKLGDAWDLFCMKAFSSYPNVSCPKELQNVALALVEKCGGLPLAILSLGGLMSSKTLKSEWENCYSSLNLELSNNPDLEIVKSVLFLSFNDLSYQLKRCFLYCCIFPEDYQIRRKRLIRLWIAEGFVEQVRGKTPERLAEDYLMELVQRSMLQVVMRNTSGRAKVCKMHDLMRELALSASEKENFCLVYDGQQASEEINGARRLSIQTSGIDLKSFKGLSSLRSFFVFCTSMTSSSSIPTFLSRFKLLRVLDLEDVAVEKLPHSVVDLFNLRYLNLRGTQIKKLPKSIARLENLLTLDIRDSEVRTLPAGIMRLQKLRHLIMYRYNPFSIGDEFCYIFGTKTPSNMSMLKKLQVLACVEAEPNLIKNLRNMTQLTRIGLTKVRKEYEKELCKSIQSMNLLHYMFLMVSDDEEYLGTDALSSAPPCLKKLILVGKLMKVPSWFDSLQGLTTLVLHWSRLSEDLIPCLQELANLGRLTLTNAYMGKQLCFSTGFNKLKRLALRKLPQLSEIIIKEGVMPGLQQLYLGNCIQLEVLPDGIEYLSNLEELDLERVSTFLVASVRVNRPRVQHIPEINHYYESSSGLSYESLSHL
ncbi:hypothetical protein RJ639_025038 [Escallonia herrerae]|uniref:Disease resistance protein RPM1-like n=2 Tax=Escallonia herrerae TaxID=1293975 RepID=A0AA88S6S2_9ASTE|nr:hypothetical protein RJ639_025038 [Escallonia herrerae]